MDLPPPPNPDQIPPMDNSNSFNSIFSSAKTQMPGIGSDAVGQINSIGRRVRMMEEAVMNLRRKLEIQEEDQLKADKRQGNDIQTLFGEVDEMKHQIKSFKDDMVKIIKELQNTAKKEELTAIKKYIEIWQPINFVTQKEVQSIVDHAIQMRLSDKTILDSLFEKNIERRSVDSTPANPELYVEPPLTDVETIGNRIRNIKKISEDEEPEVSARQDDIDKPREKISTEAYPPSILHALASHIEKERKTVSESHIHPNDPNTDILDVENKDERKTKQKEMEKYRARIDEINKRKKELHDLLGVK